MKNLDMLQLKKAEIMNKINEAIKEGNDENFAQAFNEFTDMLQQSVLDEANGIVQAADNTILTGRGVRQLTSQETEYFEGVIQAMRTSKPQQALADLEITMPITVIDAVFEDLTESHPLLEEINFQNTSGLIEMLVNKNGVELATWGLITDEIVKELTSGFKKINLRLYKLSAFLPISKSMLDLGAAWMDRYVRTILQEAIANGLEEGIVNGTGKNMPIGMNRQVGDGVTVTDGVYPLKTTTDVKDLDPTTYGELLAGMATGSNGKSRKISNVIMLVNPVDYLRKVMPATTIRGTDGKYINDVFPFPTKPIQSVHVPTGKAIFGLPKRYFMGIGTAKTGKIEYSDDYRFLEDERVYITKLYGHGEPLDNNAFVYADISNLEPAVMKIQEVPVV